jgi:methanogenic corrinoid protein MtbC1
MKNLKSGTNPVHSIAVVAARSGLSRDVLRVWERRYRAVSPARSKGGQRRYSEADLHRFMLLAEATSLGRSISTIAALTTQKLEQLVARDRAERTTANASRGTDVLGRAMEYTRALDAFGLDGLLRHAIARNGLPWFVDECAPSFMKLVGDGWATQRLTIAQEHMASAAARSVIVAAARDIRTPGSAPRVLVATPSGDQHAVGAALAMATATLEGWRVIYLGADVPAREIADSALTAGVRAVALSAVFADDSKRLVTELVTIRELLPSSVPIYVGGAAAVANAARFGANGLHVCARVADLRQALHAQAQ